MECLKCRSKWETTLSTMKNCPFCGADLYEEADEDIEVLDTSAEVLAYICRKYGADVLLGKRFSAYVADCAPELPDNVKRLIKCFGEWGAAELLRKGINGSEDDKLEAVKKSIARLTDNFISPQMAESITYEFSSALGWNVGKPAEKTVSQEKNAPKNNAEELYKLGLRYESGDGAAQSYEKAAECYRLAAEQGHAEAQNNLGVCYSYGTGVAQNYEEAYKWYRLSAEQDDSDAQYNLGVCYENGTGVAQNYEKAVKWYKFAAEQGDTMAQTKLGNFYYNGVGAAQCYREAFKWYKLAAEQGNAKAQTALGYCYENGSGAAQSYEEAVKWYRLAVEQGYAIGQYNLGECYEMGNGVTQSYEEAVKWYRLAAEQGCEEAQKKLNDIMAEK